MANAETLKFMQEATGMLYSEEQAKLISSEGGACVLACAGSGKTTAMTHLIARRLLDKSIKSGRKILGVTFSKTGATEMDERLEALLSLLDIDAAVKMKTLHAFCLEFLESIGAMRGRAVLDTYDKNNILRELGRKNTKGWKYEDGEKIAGLMTLQRGSLRSRSEFITSLDFRSSEIESLKYVAVYDAYQKYKAEKNVIDFDDMLLLAHYKLKQSFYGEDFMSRYDCVLVDEAQDMSKLQYRIVFQLLGKDAVDAGEHDAHVRNTLVLIGDDDQCQPAGTQVTLFDGSTKNIEEFVAGDKVLSYNTKEGCFPRSERGGKEVTEISAHTVPELIAVTLADGHISRYTGNHRCLAKIHPQGNEHKYVVYLMRNEKGWYRVGHTKLFVHSKTAASFGVGNSLSTEKGTDAWILKVVDTASKAWLLEQECASVYGIPQATWITGNVKLFDEASLKSLYRRLGDLSAKAESCLANFGRDIAYPLLSRSVAKKTHVSFSRTQLTEVRACNLLAGCMDMAVPIKRDSGKWTLRHSQIKDVNVQTGSAIVYGLNIADHHTYVGDGILTHNCIFEWMGSEPQGLADAMNAYRLPLYTLSTNYRCPENVLSAAARCISHNTHSVPKSMNAYKQGGNLSYLRVKGGFANESKYVADKIKEALEAGEEPGSIAVLARNGAHMTLVWLYLTCYGIKSRMFGGQSTGAGELIKHITGCFKLLTSTGDAGNVLYALFGGNKNNSEKLASLINMIDGTLPEWLEYVLSTFVPALGVVSADDNSYADAGKQWKEAMQEYYRNGGLSNSGAMDSIQRLYAASKGTPREFYLTILNIYKRAMAWKYRNDDAERVFHGTIHAFQQLITEIPEQALPMIDSLNKHRAPNKSYVVLSTAHSAKGREWNTVYLVCDDVLGFPPKFSIQQLQEAGEAHALRNLIEAERRLHYVAMTRAKNTLCVVGGENEPGRFLCEALSKPEEG
ncbi:hypothetical protein FACS1894208_00060 [Clostridia bacterium]|nr:hypothetical protein FACS1894208_00060 [Clostridia bacterium]